MAYSTRGRTAATAATVDHAICALWNPHATKGIKVISFGIFKNAAGAAGDALRGRRISARGTAGSTVTPGREADNQYGVAPVSGVLLDLAAYSTQPTLIAGDVTLGWTAPAVAGGGIVLPIPGGIIIPAGAGLAILQVAATAWPASDVFFSWLEDWM